MKISNSTVYGILAIGYIAKHKDKPIILSQEISKEYKIPLEYLLKIMQEMVKVNILRSKRGPRGGFSLARPLSKITLLDIVESIDGPMVSRLELTEIAPKEKFSKKAETVYEKALTEARKVLKQAKLSDLFK